MKQEEAFAAALVRLQEDLRQVLTLFCAAIKNPKNPIASFQKLAALEQFLGLLSYAAAAGGFKKLNDVVVTKPFPVVHVKAQGSGKTLLHLRAQEEKLVADATTPLKADVTIIADEDLLTAIVSGQPLLYHAYLANKLQIQGKVEALIEGSLGLELQQ